MLSTETGSSNKRTKRDQEIAMKRVFALVFRDFYIFCEKPVLIVKVTGDKLRETDSTERYLGYQFSSVFINLFQNHNIKVHILST